MARIIDTSQLSSILSRQTEIGLSAQGREWVYCAIDSCVTHEVNSCLTENDTPNSRLIYDFEMAQAVFALDMMFRGVRIDMLERDSALAEIEDKMERIKVVLNRMAAALWGEGLNPMSPIQQQKFFYGYMHLPKQYRKEKGERKLTVNEEALKVLEMYFYAQPFASAILEYKALHGSAKVLRSGIDADARIRVSYNVGATETGRWSSSKNVRGSGTNLQNITEEMRRIFIADEGQILVNLDLERAESFAVGYLSGDENYIEACKSFDIHTYVCKMIWPDLGWTGDEKQDKAMASKIMFDRIHDYRYMAKRSGHASNYLISAYTLAKQLGVKIAESSGVQKEYFRTFNRIPVWHLAVQNILQSTAQITSPMGRVRVFFGRLGADETLREAVAQNPQSTVADILNFGVLKIWHHLCKKGEPVQLLQQGHDSVLFQIPLTRLDLVERAKKLLETPVKVGSRTMIIPVEAKVGYNWRDLIPLEHLHELTPPALKGEALLNRIHH